MALHLFTWSSCSQELHMEGSSSITTAFGSLKGRGTAEGPAMQAPVAQIQIPLYPAYLQAALFLLKVCPCHPVTPPAHLGPM